MWYSKIVEAGALDVLAGDMDESVSFENNCRKIYYTNNAKFLPNSESIYKYLKKYLDMNAKGEYEFKWADIYYANSAIKNLLSFYYEDPEDLPKYNRFIPLAAAYAKLNNEKFSMGLSNYEVIGKYTNIHNFIYNLGYRRLLALYKEGANFPLSVAFSIISGMDLKASINLDDSEYRNELRALLLNDHPYLELFDHNKYDHKQIVDNFITLSPEQVKDIFTKTGISYEDLAVFFTALVKSGWFDKHQAFPIPLISGDSSKFYLLIHSLKSFFNISTYNEYLKTYLTRSIDNFNSQYTYPYFIKKDEVRDAIQDDINIFIDVAGKKDDFLAALGLLNRDKVIQYYLSLSSDQNNYIRKDQIPTEEEIEEYKSKKKTINQNNETVSKNNTAVNNTAVNNNTSSIAPSSTQNPNKNISLFDRFVNSGDIEIKTLNDPEYSKIVDDIAHSLGYTENEQDILDYVKSTQVIVMKTPNFYIELNKLKPPKYASFNMDDLKSAGSLKYHFTARPGDTPKMAIQLNNFNVADAVKKDKIFQAINLSIDDYNLATLAHETAHLLDVGIKGGLDVFKNLDPKTSLKAGETYNQSRLYLSDIREIVARVYGNLPFMAQVLHNQIETMRTDKIIQEAAMSELVDMIMSNEASWLLATPMVDEGTLQSWAEAGFGDYQKSKTPYTDATKTYLRQKEKARDFYIEQGKRHRRDILLSFIKEMNSLKKQLRSVINATDENDIRTKAKLESDIKAVQAKIENAKRGAYDHDINLVIRAIANYIAFNDLKITNDIVSDPAYKSQPSITSPENYAEGIVGDYTPLTFQELRGIKDFDLARLQEGEEGGKTLKEKRPSFMSFDLYNPDWKEDFRKDQNIPSGQQKTSFNFKKWNKN